MPSPLISSGYRLFDAALVAQQSNFVQTALNATVGTLAAGLITGGSMVTLISTNGTPGAQTTRTALQLWGDDPTALIGWGYTLRICNGGGSGTLTLTAGSGVTITGTATVANATWRDFLVVYSGTNFLPVVTMTNVGTGTYS